MLKVQPEQDRMDDADQVSAPNPSCLELIVETDLTAEFRRNYPTRVQELDARIQGAKSVAWEACHH